jgi:hypothetical protein
LPNVDFEGVDGAAFVIFSDFGAFDGLQSEAVKPLFFGVL